jgi:Inner membrane component domain
MGDVGEISRGPGAFLLNRRLASLNAGALYSSIREPTIPLTSILLNLLWIAFGGLWMAFAWAIAAVLMAITIVGIPWTRAALNIAAYTLIPFGQTHAPIMSDMKI